MARKIATIKEGIRETKNTYPQLAPILFAEEGGSIAGLFNLEADTFAQQVGILEQLWDQYQSDVTGMVAQSVPTTDQWLFDKIMAFQWSADTPQVVQLINLVPQYPIVDPTLLIISRASVVNVGNGNINVKVATGNPPQALSTDQQTALGSYLSIINSAGPKCIVSSSNADILASNINIYFDGQYISSIQTDVPTAIDNYLAGIPFNGVVKQSDLELAIKEVEGVTDVVINACYARINGTTFSTATPMGRNYATVAGYIIRDTTNTVLTYTAE